VGLAGARHDQAVAYGRRLQTHAAGVERELLTCKRRKAADGAEEALLAVVPDALQDVPMPEATETDSEPDPEPTPSAEIETFYPTSLCDREWERYTCSAIEQSAERALAQRNDELGARFREFMASSNPMHEQIADSLRKAVGAVRRVELRYWWRMHRAEERHGDS